MPATKSRAKTEKTSEIGHPEDGDVLGVLLEEASGEDQHEEDQRRERRYGRDDQLLAYGLHGPPI